MLWVASSDQPEAGCQIRQGFKKHFLHSPHFQNPLQISLDPNHFELILIHIVNQPPGAPSLRKQLLLNKFKSNILLINFMQI